MSKHTPGPWLAQPRTWQRGNVSVFAPKFGRVPYGACVAFIPCSEGVGGADGALANARLIAAAPDLLEALRKCNEALTWELGGEPLDTLMMDARNAARAALAKVEASK